MKFKKFKVNKATIIEEANLYSQILRNKLLTQATQNQNARLGAAHPASQRNLEIMSNNSRRPIQENAAVKAGAVGAVGFGVKKGAQALKKAIDGDDLGNNAVGALSKHTKAINNAIDDMN